MKHALHITLFAGLFAGSIFGFDGYPQADRMEPRIAKVGTVITIHGRSLEKEKVDEVYLTDHRFDMKVKVLEQSENTLKIRIPPFAKPGRLQLLLLSAGEKPAFLEQPLYVQVEEADAPAVEAPAKPVEVTTAAPPKAKPVEVASAGNHIPVPAAPAASPMGVPVPQQPQPAPVKREEPPQPQPQQPAAATPAPAPVVAATTAAVPAAPPASAPSTPANVREIIAPRLIKRTQVSMPPLSPTTAGGDGAVELLVHVRTDGRVGTVKAIRGNPILAQAAMRSVRDWVYESAYIGSTPVEADVTVVLNFKRQ